MRIAIVGGGAAGLMAAVAIHETSASTEVFLLEKNDGLGKKVLITGGGRCNVTTGLQDIRTILTKYPRGGKFLTSAMHAFPPSAMCAWLEEQGVPLKTEEDLRVFPQSNNGKDIVDAFTHYFETAKTHVLLHASVTRVEKQGTRFAIFTKPESEPLLVDRIILTAGGQAYRQTGSTGDGYALAQSLGHTITTLAPSLNAFLTRESWPASIAGISFPRATLTINQDKHLSTTGPFIFTHKGLSGPAVFALSSLVAFASYSAQKPLELAIDLFPDMTDTLLADRLNGRIALFPKKTLENNLEAFVPRRFAEILCMELDLPINQHSAEISKQERKRIVAWLKHVPLRVIGRDAGEEFVTAGGVDTKEVNPRTMESLICPGLFIAGELLNVDGFTGGFNLQAAWATGHLAGTHSTK